MVDVLPLVLLGFGLLSVFKPEWIAVVHRRQKAAGTTRKPRDIEVTESWLRVTQIAGVAFVLFGLLFTLRSL